MIEDMQCWGRKAIDIVGKISGNSKSNRRSQRDEQDLKDEMERVQVV